MNTFEDFLKWETAESQSVDYKPIYTDMAGGDVVAGLLLSQIVWWCYIPSKHTNKTKLRVEKEGHLWLAKGREDWYSELRITARQFDRTIKILESEGIVIKKVFKFYGNPTIHLRLDTEKFVKHLNHYLQAGYDEALEADDAFVDDEKQVADIGEYDHQPVYLSSVNSISPNGENYNIEEASDTSKEVSEAIMSPSDDLTPQCSRCGSPDIVAEKLDEHGRCALCLYVDAWDYYIRIKGLAYTVNDRGLRDYGGTQASKTVRRKIKTRLKDKEFRDWWKLALERASLSRHLKSTSQAWFKIIWFVTNGEHYTRVLEGNYDWKEEQDFENNWIHVKARAKAITNAWNNRLELASQLASEQAEQASQQG